MITNYFSKLNVKEEKLLSLHDHPKIFKKNYGNFLDLDIQKNNRSEIIDLIYSSVYVNNNDASVSIIKPEHIIENTEYMLKISKLTLEEKQSILMEIFLQSMEELENFRHCYPKIIETLLNKFAVG